MFYDQANVYICFLVFDLVNLQIAMIVKHYHFWWYSLFIIWHALHSLFKKNLNRSIWILKWLIFFHRTDYCQLDRYKYLSLVLDISSLLRKNDLSHYVNCPHKIFMKMSNMKTMWSIISLPTWFIAIAFFEYRVDNLIKESFVTSKNEQNSLPLFYGLS